MKYLYIILPLAFVLMTLRVIQIAFTSVGSFPLMALPAFILAGALMEEAGISRRLVNLVESFAGPFLLPDPDPPPRIHHRPEIFSTYGYIDTLFILC